MTLPNLDAAAKLAAPVKKSVFERQKEEAEAKKAREKAETAAVLEDFVKSFDDDGDDSYTSAKRGGPPGGGFGGSGSFAAGPGKRHFTSSGLKSGPGSLGPAPSLPKSGPGSLGPAPSFGKKRHHDDYRDRDRDRDRDRRDRIFSYNEDRDEDKRREARGFDRDEDDAANHSELQAAAKPTLHLSSLPPGTSPAIIKGLFAPSPLTVEDVRLLPASAGTASERKSCSAIVTLAAETPATDIDTMVSHLQNRYMGFGFNLSISRHLSSAALTGAHSLSNNAPSASWQNLPFGAKPIPQHTPMSRAPPPGQGPARFAPPASYTSSTPYASRQNNLPGTQVTVQTPNDLQQLRLVHKTLEALLTYGPEFEALLMSRPEIQRDEQWAWLWNSRSIGGVYYRWRLWETLTNADVRNRQRPVAYGGRPRGDILFEGQSVWVPPEDGLRFEYTTKLEDFISDDDYNSSDEEDNEDGGGGLARRYHDHQRLAHSDSGADNDGTGYLNPLAKTKLVHLLSRLPESNAKLRKGDVARVTGFAIEHAGAGADEVGALITRNVVQPFRYNVSKPKASEDSAADHADSDKEMTDVPALNNPADSELVQSQTTDSTPASLVALFVISDILSSSASSGVRHAWRYRALFETQLRDQDVFAILGRAARQQNWGKLKAEKWRRSVQSVLGLWEGWCVFPQKAQDEFVDRFLNPPLTKREREEEDRLQKLARATGLSESQKYPDKDTETKATSRWRTVDTSQPQFDASHDPDLDGTPMREADADVEMDGTPMAMTDDDDDDSKIDGIPMVDSSDEDEDEDKSSGMVGATDHRSPDIKATSTPAADDTNSCVPAKADGPTSSHRAAGMRQGKRVRPRAVDFDDADANDDVDMFE